MKRTTFTDKVVADYYNQNFVNLAIDIEKGEGPVLAEKFGVEAYPTLIYFMSDGKVIDKVIGFKKPEEFLEI